jgi:group I intron endonuclease
MDFIASTRYVIVFVNLWLADMKAVIYKLTAPNGKCYIGQSVNFKKRVACYHAGTCKGQVKLYHAILKYGFDTFSIEMLEEIDKVEDYISRLNELEIAYIAKYNCVEDGLNLQYGGRNGLASAESKAKMSKVQTGNQHWLGKHHTAETKAKMKFARQNMSAESILNVSLGQLGRKHTDESKLKMSLARKAMSISESHRAKLIGVFNGVNSRAVSMYDMNLNFLQEFPSASEAARQTGLRRPNITNVCTGYRRAYKQYIFRYSSTSNL